MEMKKYKLRELLTIKNGKDHKQLKEGVYPVLGSGGVMRYVDTFLYDKPSVLLPRKGTLNNIQYSDKPFWTVDTLYYTEVNQDLTDTYYLFNYLKLLDLSNLDSGTGVPSMTFDSYYNLSVNLPSLKNQNKIATILAHINKKIAINRQINRNLEELAKQIYDYWFVQFDFPDENGKPYKSSGGKMVWNEDLKREIPEDWEVKRLENVIKVNRGGSPRPIDEFLSDKGLHWLKISDATVSSSPFILDTKEFIIEEGLNKTVMIKAGSLVLSNSATPGMPRILDIDTCIHDGWLYFSKSELSNEFLYLFFLKMRENIVKYANGSIFLNLKTDVVKDFKIILPSYEILKLFDNIIKPNFSQILNIEREIKKLTDLRDRLLPLLMNGQVTLNSYLSHD